MLSRFTPSKRRAAERQREEQRAAQIAVEVFESFDELGRGVLPVKDLTAAFKVLYAQEQSMKPTSQVAREVEIALKVFGYEGGVVTKEDFVCMYMCAPSFGYKFTKSLRDEAMSLNTMIAAKLQNLQLHVKSAPIDISTPSCNEARELFRSTGGGLPLADEELATVLRELYKRQKMLRPMKAVLKEVGTSKAIFGYHRKGPLGEDDFIRMYCLSPAFRHPATEDTRELSLGLEATRMGYIKQLRAILNRCIAYTKPLRNTPPGSPMPEAPDSPANSPRMGAGWGSGYSLFGSKQEKIKIKTTRSTGSSSRSIASWLTPGKSVLESPQGATRKRRNSATENLITPRGEPIRPYPIVATPPGSPQGEPGARVLDNDIRRVRALSQDTAPDTALLADLGRVRSESQANSPASSMGSPGQGVEICSASPPGLPVVPPSDAEPLIQAALRNFSTVVEEAHAKGENANWKPTGKSQGANCFMHTASGQGPQIGVFGRGRVVASRDDIIRAIADPANMIVDQTVETVGYVPMNSALTSTERVPGVSSDMAELRWVSVRPPLISARDFCVLSWNAPVPEDGVPPEKWEWVSCAVSVTHPMVGERKKFIRGEVVFNGWHVKPLPPKKGEVSCGVTVMSLTRMGGKLPGALLKMGAKEGGAMLARLKKNVES